MRLGINIDHVATLRNARGGTHPCPLRAAECCTKAGADSITVHLREDRRHIRDADVEKLVKEQPLPINLEMAATREMQQIALSLKPHAVCLVPEKRQELTTEGGLDVAGNEKNIAEYLVPLNRAGIRTSLFIDPDTKQVEAAQRTGAKCIELHTGTYAERFPDSSHEHGRLKQAAMLGHKLGLEIHAGHGLDYKNVVAVAAIEPIIELNIGHFLIGEAIFTGLETSIRQMREIIEAVRKTVS